MSSEPTGYELDADTFALYLKALILKMNEEGSDPNDQTIFLETMRRWWFIMQDVDLVKAYVASQIHDGLAAQEADLTAALAAVQLELENE